MPASKQELKTNGSDLAHGLRTSLSIIKVNSEVALLDENLDPKHKKRLQSNVEEVDRIARTLTQLLDSKEK